MANRNTDLNRVDDDLVNFQVAVDTPVVLLAPDCAVRRFNTSAATRFRIEAGDVGRTFDRQIGGLRRTDGDGDGRVDLERMIADALESLLPQEIEVHDENGRWHALRLRPYLTPDRKVDGAVLTLVDIDAVKRSELAAAHLAAIVSSSDYAIISMDLHGVIRSWNDAAERLYGYTAEQAIGQAVAMLIPADHEDEEPEILDRLRRGESIDHYETVRMHKDGTLIDVSLTISPVKDSAGRVIGAAKIARDITEGKRLRRELEAKNEDLARFNEVAVGRELRMIELKKELNELCLRLGEPIRYPLDFEEDGGGVESEEANNDNFTT